MDKETRNQRADGYMCFVVSVLGLQLTDMEQTKLAGVFADAMYSAEKELLESIEKEVRLSTGEAVRRLRASCSMA